MPREGQVRGQVGSEIVTRAQECKSICSRGPQKTRSGHSPRSKPKGREPSGGETRKEFISGKPAPGGQQTSVSKTVSKVQTIPVGLSKQNVGHRTVGTCRWTVKVRGWLSWVNNAILLASAQSLLLEGAAQFPSGDALPTGSFAWIKR